MTLKNFFCNLLPVALLIFLFLAENVFTSTFHGVTSSELGMVESLQALVLLAGFLYSLYVLLWGVHNQIAKPLMLWLGFATLCLLYIFLEEISYGQHYVGWTTPEFWAQRNDQNETNLHNTSSWFDQKPRQILEAGVIIGGVIVPILRKRKPGLPILKKFNAILPHDALFVTAIAALIPRWVDKVYMAPFVAKDLHPFIRVSEVQELYFYYFMLLYLIFFRLTAKEKGLTS